jgi:hypothetical protein
VKINDKSYPFMDGMVVGNWRKALSLKNLGRGRAARRVVSPYAATLYIDNFF